MLSLRVAKRVVSVWKPSTMMSDIRRMCSAMFPGMPSPGRALVGLSRVGLQPCSRRAGRRWRCASRPRAPTRGIHRACAGRRCRGRGAGGGVAEHGIEHALVAAAGLVLEQAVEGQRGIDLERGRGGRRAPRDVRAVEHRVVLVHRGIRLLAAQHQAGDLGRAAVAWRQQLVDAGARSGSRRRRRAARRRAGCRSASCGCCPWRLGVEQPADEQRLLARGQERGEHLAELQRLAFAPGPPFLAVEAVAGEQHREAHRGLAGGGAGAIVAPGAQRLHPGQGHGDAEAAQEGAAAAEGGIGSDGVVLGSGVSRCHASQHRIAATDLAELPAEHDHIDGGADMPAGAASWLRIMASSGSSESCTERPRA